MSYLYPAKVAALIRSITQLCVPMRRIGLVNQLHKYSSLL